MTTFNTVNILLLGETVLVCKIMFGWVIVIFFASPSSPRTSLVCRWVCRLKAVQDVLDKRCILAKGYKMFARRGRTHTLSTLSALDDVALPFVELASRVLLSKTFHIQPAIQLLNL